MKLKISQKLIGLFVLIGLTPFLCISIYAFFNSKSALEKKTFAQLSFLEESRKEAIVLYLNTVQRQVSTQARNIMTIDAMDRLTMGFTQYQESQSLNFKTDEDKVNSRLKARYAHQQSKTINAPVDATSSWWPQQWFVKYLQYRYIAENPFPINEKQKLDLANDDTAYAMFHGCYHPVYRNFIENFGFHDLFLVEAKTGHIVYSVSKEVDFATSLITGPYAGTHIATVFQKAVTAKTPGAIFFSDYAPYAPSYNQPAAFIASPVFDRDTVTGVIIFQVPMERINSIMTNDHKWESVGLGKSGESLLIGPDFKFRSTSRHFVEEPEVLSKQLLAAGVDLETIEHAKNQKSDICVLSYDTPVVRAALQGEKGVDITSDYRGIPVISGYAPLDTLGTRWAVVTAIDKDEAFESFYRLRKAMIILSIVGAIAVLVTGFLLARSISRPLNEVIGVLSSSSAEITTSVTQQESVAQQQASAVQETNATMEELGSSSKLSAQQADSAASGAQQALDLSEEGRQKMKEMVGGMDTLKEKVDDIAKQILHLSEQTGKIGDITNLVSDFANETKMLAMNAAVEAVRAGEHGKGFSVLSVEIRKLADESKRSAERINTLVGEIQKVTNATVMATEEGTKNVVLGTQLAKETSTTFHNVSHSIGEAAQNTKQIALNVQQQAIAVKQVVEAMGTLNQGARENSSGIGQVKTGIQTLNDAAQTLKQMV